MIIFLYGEDTYRSRVQLRKIIEKFKADRDPAGYNVVVIDAVAESTADRMIQEILCVPFLAERRLVVIESIFSSKFHQELSSGFSYFLQEKSIPDTTVVVLWEGGEIGKGKEVGRLFERLKQEKYAQEFSLLRGPQFAGWIAGEVQARGGSIASTAAQYLAGWAKNSWEASSLIDVCLAYAAGREIALTDVLRFTDDQQNADTVFVLVDAILHGRGKDAFAELRRQYEHGADASYIFAMIIRQVRILLQLRDLFDRGDLPASASVASLLKFHPFVVKKSLAGIRERSFRELANIHAALTSMDIEMKTGGRRLEVALDAFIGRESVKTLR